MTFGGGACAHKRQELTIVDLLMTMLGGSRFTISVTVSHVILLSDVPMYYITRRYIESLKGMRLRARKRMQYT